MCIMNNKKIEFLHGDLKKIFPKIHPRTLIYWVERGLLQPAFEEASGRGSRRRFSFNNLIEIGFLGELLSHGITFSVIKRIVESTNYKMVFEKEEFDTVFWFFKQSDTKSLITLQYDEAPIDGFIRQDLCFGTAPMKEFQKRGGNLLFIGESEFVTRSAIIINFKGIVSYIEDQISLL